MNLEELTYFIIGIMLIYIVYWSVFGFNQYVSDSHKTIVPEPNNLLVSYGESAGMVYGEEENE